jgi:hypothetical protein
MLLEKPLPASVVVIPILWAPIGQRFSFKCWRIWDCWHQQP